MVFLCPTPILFLQGSPNSGPGQIHCVIFPFETETPRRSKDSSRGGGKREKSGP